MKMKRVLALLLAVGMFLGGVGCKKDEKPTDNQSKAPTVDSNSPYASLGLSQPVTIKMFVLGEAPPDMQKVQEEANKIFFKPLVNATLDINFLSWSNYQTKYSLVLASGDQCDLIYTAQWCSYNQEAAKGAFKELTMDWVNRYMPLTARSQAVESWEQVSIGGKVFAVPQNDINFAAYKYIAVRDDLREKYGLVEITDIDTLENYLFTIAEKEKGIQAIDSAGGNPIFRRIMVEQANRLQAVDGGYDFFWNMDNKPDAPASGDVFYILTSNYFKQYAKKMVTWADKGVWPKNAINNTISVNDSFGQGKGAAIAWNGSIFAYGKQLEDAGIGKAGYVDLTPDLLFRQSSYANDAIAIAAMSKNPERASMVLDLMKNNDELNNLLVGGIKDVHYILDSQGRHSSGPEAHKYGWDTWSWGIRRANPLESSDKAPKQVSMEEKVKARILKTDIEGFTFDEGPVKPELVAINSIRDEYVPSFELGAFGSNTDAKFEEFKRKLDKSGLKKVQDEFTKQLSAYVAKKK
jgi:ABC-type glycerol-3-phosphate transport system substrate-binding protein